MVGRRVLQVEWNESKFDNEVQVNPGVTKRVNASLCDTKIDLTLKYFKILLVMYTI